MMVETTFSMVEMVLVVVGVPFTKCSWLSQYVRKTQMVPIELCVHIILKILPTTTYKYFILGD